MDEKQIRSRLDSIEKVTEKYLDRARECVMDYIRANNSEILREIKKEKNKNNVSKSNRKVKTRKKK
jgi:hypothetical protein